MRPLAPETAALGAAGFLAATGFLAAALGAAALAAGVDLTVSGHTHRGQLYPNHWVTQRLYEIDWGYLQKGSLHAIVSSGFGTWGPPVRTSAKSEIVEIKVKFRQSKK